jgi:glucose-6-phosphate dehydrogenase assembly protein OpcA
MRRELTDTTTSAIRMELMRANQQLGTLATGVVLNLVIMTDESAQYDAMRAASQAAREHPCRVLGVIGRHERTEPRLDAEIMVGENAAGQTVLLRIYGELNEHADSVVAPLLVADTPVVTWWPGKAPLAPASDPIGVLAQRRITDAAAGDSPDEVLGQLATGYQPGDTDLSWARTTTWRSLLAATLDRPYGPISAVVVSSEPGNPSAALMAAWLADCLGVPVRRDITAGPGVTGVAFTTAAGEISISRPDGRNATLSRPGEPDRYVALHRREIAELLAEELRRMDPDEVYAEALGAVAGHVTSTARAGEE